MTITKTYLGMKAVVNQSLTDAQRTMLQYVLAAYGFVLPEYKRTFTAWEWCEYIRKTYDISEIRNEAAVSFILSLA
jgi:hypothetical protein